jgi:inner membrane protein
LPTLITHALLPVIGAAAVPRLRLSNRVIGAAIVAAMLPDADVVGRLLFDYPGTHPLGHRGWTHSIVFALLVGLVGMAGSSALRASPRLAFAILFLGALSHPLTDMLTDGGRGVMLLWPLSLEKMHWPVRPVEISPLGLRGFEDGRMWEVLASEALWLVAPALILAFLCRLWSDRHIDSVRGET